MISFFANIFGYILNYIYNFIGNYGWAIIIFSILVKILMSPISIKQQKTVKKTAKIQQKMKEIQLKYKGNQEKLNEATIELYKSENMSPFSGCLSAIVQIVLLFSVFYLVRSPLTYMKKVDTDVINKYSTIIQENEISPKSNYPEIDIIREIDSIKNLKKDDQEENSQEKIDLSEINDEELDNMNINMEFLGLNLAQVPTKSSDWKAYIIPFLYVIISIVSMKMTTMNTNKNENDEEFDAVAQMNKNMTYTFPIMYLAVALIAPLGLALYWLMNSLLMIVERVILNKLFKDEEEEN